MANYATNIFHASTENKQDLDKIDPERFAAAIPDMHPTLQQSLYRLIKACIKVMADETRHYDERNQASHEEAKRIMEYLNEHGRNIPLK